MKLLFGIIFTVYVLYNLIYNSNINNYNATHIKYVNTHKKKYSLRIKTTKRCMRKTNNCQAYFIRLLLLSGNVELNPGPVTCPICQQSFGRHWRLDDHQRNANIINCNICQRSFCHRYRLEQHKHNKQTN